MTRKFEELSRIFEQLFLKKWPRSELQDHADLLAKFVFHMCDISDDMAQLARLYAESPEVQGDEAARIVEQVFLHSVPHLMAAAQIYDYIPEIFEEQRGVHIHDDLETHVVKS